MTEKDYNFTVDTLPDLDAGILEQKLSRAIREVALACTEHREKKGKVVLELNIDALGDSNQVVCAHRLAYKRPTKRGFRQEDDTTRTVLHVGRGGRLTIIPDTQTDMFQQQETTADDD